MSDALNNIAAFVRCQLTGRALPSVTWRHENSDTNKSSTPVPAGDAAYRLSILASPAPAQARLWMATAQTGDFRNSRWESRPIKMDTKPDAAGRIQIVTDVPRPESGFVAFYADLNYKVDELPLWLCTQLRLEGSPAKTEDIPKRIAKN